MELEVVRFQHKVAGLGWRIINKWFSTHSWLVSSWKIAGKLVLPNSLPMDHP